MSIYNRYLHQVVGPIIQSLETVFIRLKLSTQLKAVALSILLTGCSSTRSTPSQPPRRPVVEIDAHEPSETNQTKLTVESSSGNEAVDGKLPTEEDFRRQADSEITEHNWEQKLDELEKELNELP